MLSEHFFKSLADHNMEFCYFDIMQSNCNEISKIEAWYCYNFVDERAMTIRFELDFLDERVDIILRTSANSNTYQEGMIAAARIALKFKEKIEELRRYRLFAVTGTNVASFSQNIRTTIKKHLLKKTP